MDAAKSEGAKGNWYEAALALEQAAEDLKGLPAAATAVIWPCSARRRARAMKVPGFSERGAASGGSRPLGL